MQCSESVASWTSLDATHQTLIFLKESCGDSLLARAKIGGKQNLLHYDQDLRPTFKLLILNRRLTLFSRCERLTTPRALHAVTVNAPDLSGRNRVTAFRARCIKRGLDLLAVDFLLGDHWPGWKPLPKRPIHRLHCKNDNVILDLGPYIFSD